MNGKSSSSSSSLSRTEDQVLASTKITSNIATELFDVIASLNSSADSEEFKEPVNWKDLGLDDYPTIIKRPRDLGTVEARLLLTVKSKKFKKHPQAHIAKECGRYNSVLEFFNDIEQIWQNCITYNGVSSEIAYSAIRMRAMGRTRKNTWIQTMAPELVKNGQSQSPATTKLSTVTPSTSSEDVDHQNDEVVNGGKRKRSHEKGKIKGKDGNDDKRKKKSKTRKTTQDNTNNNENKLFSDDDGKNKNKKGNVSVINVPSSNGDDAVTNGELRKRDWMISPKEDKIEHLGRRISKLHYHHLTEVVKFMSLTGIDEVIKIRGEEEDDKSSIILNLDALSPHLFWALDTMVSAQLSRQARSKALKLVRDRDDTLSPVS